MSPIRQYYDMGISVSINSDDPPYFNGYLNDNYFQINDTKEFEFAKKDFVRMAKYSFEGSFLEPHEKLAYISEIEDYALRNYVTDDTIIETEMRENN